jgi:hypothetical protein
LASCSPQGVEDVVDEVVSKAEAAKRVADREELYSIKGTNEVIADLNEPLDEAAEPGFIEVLANVKEHVEALTVTAIALIRALREVEGSGVMVDDTCEPARYDSIRDLAGSLVEHGKRAFLRVVTGELVRLGHEAVMAMEGLHWGDLGAEPRCSV